VKFFGTGLSEQHKELNKIIRKKDSIENAKELFLELHGKLHLSSVSNSIKNEVDELLEDLTVQEYAIMPSIKDETIAWVLWHIARIEDLTMNILINNDNQIFNDEWKKRLNVTITDTGNALSDDEIMQLSKDINITELLNYRNAVGKQTRTIVNKFLADDMKRKIEKGSLDRILQEGGVTNQEQSIWLLDFWSKKDVAGLLLMPPTRHVMLHLNDCSKWKKEIRTKRKFFRVKNSHKTYLPF
jgi:hypothetical protein